MKLRRVVQLMHDPGLCHVELHRGSWHLPDRWETTDDMMRDFREKIDDPPQLLEFLLYADCKDRLKNPTETTYDEIHDLFVQNHDRIKTVVDSNARALAALVKHLACVQQSPCNTHADHASKTAEYSAFGVPGTVAYCLRFKSVRSFLNVDDMLEIENKKWIYYKHRRFTTALFLLELNQGSEALSEYYWEYQVRHHALAARVLARIPDRDVLAFLASVPRLIQTEQTRAHFQVDFCQDSGSDALDQEPREKRQKTE
jgi:hypothetical protein